MTAPRRRSAIRSIVTAVALLSALLFSTHSRADVRGAPQPFFSTYLGGGGSDYAQDIAVEPDGSIVVAGYVDGKNVVRLSGDGSQILGGAALPGADIQAVAVGTDGSIYLTGFSQGGLTTVRPIQAAVSGQFDAFVAKLSPDLSQVLFSTYLGGTSAAGDGFELGYGIDVGSDGTIYVVGRTTSADNSFPLMNPSQSTFGGGESDGFVSVIDATTPRLLFSTYFGDANADELKSCSVDRDTGDFYVFGGSEPNFGTSQKLQGHEECETVLVLLARYLKGSDLTVFELGDIASYCKKARYKDVIGKIIKIQLQVPARKKIVVVDSDIDTQKTGSPRLGRTDIRLWLYDTDLTLERTVVLGGAGDDYPRRLAVDDNGTAYLIGETRGQGFPVTGGFQPDFGGTVDSFLLALDAQSLQPFYGSYIGGDRDEYPAGIGLGDDGDIVVAGNTISMNFPTTPDAFQTSLRGDSDAWVLKLPPVTNPGPDFSLAALPESIEANRGQSGSVEIDINRRGGLDGSITVLAPDTKSIKVKWKPAQSSTSGDSVSFTFKVKKKAVAGTHQLVFTGRDGEGRERTVPLPFVIH